MKAAFYQTISAIVAGIAIAAVSFYIFTQRPESPVAGIEIEYRKLDASRTLFAETVKIAVGDQVIDKSKIVDNLVKEFGFGRSVALLQYTITNSSDREIKQISAHLGDHILGYISDDNGVRVFDADEKTVQFRALPKTIATLFMIVDYPSWELSERFLVDGQAVPIKEIESRYGKPPFSELFEQQPFLFVMAAALGSICAVVLLFGLVFALLTQNKPDVLAHLTDSDNAARALALLNWMRIENFEKYEKIVDKAERMHSKWSKRT